MIDIIVLKRIADLPSEAMISSSPFFSTQEITEWAIKNKAKTVWAWEHHSKKPYFTAWYNPKEEKK